MATGNASVHSNSWLNDLDEAEAISSSGDGRRSTPNVALLGKCQPFVRQFLRVRPARWRNRCSYQDSLMAKSWTDSEFVSLAKFSLDVALTCAILQRFQAPMTVNRITEVRT